MRSGGSPWPRAREASCNARREAAGANVSRTVAGSLRIRRKMKVDPRVAELTRVGAQVVQAFEHVRVAQRSDIDRLEADAFDELRNGVLRVLIVPRDRHADGVTGDGRIPHRARSERVERFDDSGPGRGRLNPLRVRAVERVIA